MNNSASSAGGDSENCENCSSSFTLFKRKKICNLCKQAFCQACVNRQTFTSVLNNRNTSTSNSCSSSSTTSERICVICQMICAPQTTVDDLMKLKLKHLRSILNTANVATSTCKEKRDLVDLVLRNRFKFQQRPTTQTQPNQQQQQQQQNNPPPPPQPQSNLFNDTFSNFMNNVQEFVNFNLNSALNQPHPAPAPSSSSASNASNTTQNPKKSFTQSSTNFNINGQPTSTSSASSSSTSTNQIPSSSSTSNLNSIFNLIGEQVPNVLQQTFNNNRFNFNNVFNNSTSSNNLNTERRGSTSSNSGSTNRQATPPSPPSPAPPPPQPQTDPVPPPPQQQQQQNSSSFSESEMDSFNSTHNTASSIPKRRASLSDIKSESDIENLTVKQIKEILASNFVDYKGCCEKKELIDKAKRLYNSHENNKRLERELINSETQSNLTSEIGATSSSLNSIAGEGANSSFTSSFNQANSASGDVGATINSRAKPIVDESDLCKICMESLIDCVLLDCGHMVSCTKCGKRLAECPICRQNVIRVIRVFKS